MNATIRSLLCAAALAAAPMVYADPPLATSGTVLVIDYDRLLEGRIERIDKHFRIRESDGGEMNVPATAAMVLLPDRESAYQLIRSRAKTGDPLEHVRLARWCLSNRFNQHAIEEAEAALALQPEDRSFVRFRDDVKQRAALAPPASVTATPGKSAPKLLAPEPAVVDVNPESFSVFVTKVQPILMNACAGCHGGERGGQFHLARTGASFSDQKATQANLAAASLFLNRDQPSASPLLVRAVSLHGDSARPPLRDRQTPAFKHLEEWARLATGKPLTPPASAPPATLPPEAIADALPLNPEPTQPKAKAGEAPPAVVVPAFASDPPKRPEPNSPAAKPPAPPMPPAQADTPKTEPSDPFDPMIFNKLNGERRKP